MDKEVILILIVVIFSNILNVSYIKKMFITREKMSIENRFQSFLIIQLGHSIFMILVFVISYQKLSEVYAKSAYLFYCFVLLTELILSMRENYYLAKLFPLLFRNERSDDYVRYVPYKLTNKWQKILLILLSLMVSVMLVIGKVWYSIKKNLLFIQLSPIVYVLLIIILLIARYVFSTYIFHEYRIKNHMKRLDDLNKQIDLKIKNGTSLSDQIENLLDKYD